MLHGTIPNGRRTTHTWALPAAPLPSMPCRMMRLATCKKSHERPIGLGTVTAFKHDCLRGAEGVLDKLQAFSEAGGEASKWFGEGNVHIADCLKRRRSPALPSHLLDCSVSLQLNSASIPLSRVLEMDLPQEPMEWSESDLKLFGLGERKAVVLRRLDSDEVGLNLRWFPDVKGVTNSNSHTQETSREELSTKEDWDNWFSRVRYW